MKIEFQKKGNITNYTQGNVYFDSSTHTIKVGTGTNSFIVYSGVRSADYDSELQILTIVNQDGYEYELDLNQPVVNNASITIKKNDASIGSFTLNQGTDASINIEVNEIPTVTSSDNGKVLQVVNGVWTKVMPVTLYTGEGTPINAQGNNGDIYLQT